MMLIAHILFFFYSFLDLNVAHDDHKEQRKNDHMKIAIPDAQRLLVLWADCPLLQEDKQVDLSDQQCD